MRIPVICVDDSNRPETVPTSKWVNKGDKYHITKIDFMNAQNRVLGAQLEEVDLSSCFPYTYFALNRFAPIVPPAEKVESKKEEEVLEEVAC